MKSVLHAVLGAVLLSAATAPNAHAQTPPPPSQAPEALQQAVQQNAGVAEAIRQRIKQSGLTPEQIRARLQATGYSASLLDQYLGAAVPGQVSPPPGPQELSALTSLGLPPLEPSELGLPVDTGFIANRGLGATRRSDVFGIEMFRRTTTQFLPLLAGPVPPDYKLGPGDNLALILTGDVELAYSLQVSREGFILIPQVGQVHIVNLTMGQLRDVLYARLGRVYSGVRRGAAATTRFDVSVASVRANQLYVVGEVTQPGAYQISSLGTVLTALYAAGGVTDNANLRRIEVRRLGKTVATLDLYDYLLAGDTRSDIRLETGDIVFVPIHGVRARATGAVNRPAIYELKPGETLADLVRAAGGFAPDASLRRVAIHRIVPVSGRGAEAVARSLVDVELKGGTIPSVAIESGDSVVVDALHNLAGSYHVTIVGMVDKPGRYPWHDGMTLRDLVILARGPVVGADLREAEIAKLPADRSHGQLATTVRVPLDSTYLYQRDADGRYVGVPGVGFPSSGTAPEVPLEPFDNVLILRQPGFELQRTVTITGQVNYPGSYALRSRDDRLSDLVGRAGGLTSRAYPEGIRFVRSVANAGRINIDLPRALRDTTSRDNVILQPGDEVNIPEYQASVRVVGAVNSPGSVLYRPGAGLEYYLSAAGGFNQLANKKGVSVRFANGEVRTSRKTLFFRSDPAPGPGSEVLVPARDPRETKTDYVALFGAIAQVLASTIAIIVVVKR
jgi:protein involved in polysaccharide export with SLBB domain